jgi:hypothetical protein
MMSAIAHAGSSVNVCHAKSSFFGSSKSALMKAAPSRVRRRTSVAARADASVWTSMSGFMKNKCKEAAALESKDKEAGRAAWIELDKQVPGARLAFADSSTVDAANGMETFCAGNDDAEECKVFDE